MDRKVGLLAPVGSFEALTAAIDAGADAIYFGLKKLNMRSHGAVNFELEEIPEIVDICKKNGVKCYLTLNCVVYDEEIKEVKEICNLCKLKGVDAIIASDMAVIAYARSINLSVHLSTQCNISNIVACTFFANFADVIVLARELSLEQIQKICNYIKENEVKGPKGELLKIELFVHGALCVAIAGKCQMSLAQYNKSANRGECLQVCRRQYEVEDVDTKAKLVIDNHYVMSPSDLCTIASLDKILQSGVSILKIEGRSRSADYVKSVVKAYKEAIEAVKNKSYTKEKIDGWVKELKKVYNRNFWEGGYYLGKKGSEWSGSYGSQATVQKIYAGKVTNYFSNLKVAEIKLESALIKPADNILIIGKTTGSFEMKVENIPSNQKLALGELITILVTSKVRKNDKVYLLKDV